MNRRLRFSEPSDENERAINAAGSATLFRLRVFGLSMDRICETLQEVFRVYVVIDGRFELHTFSTKPFGFIENRRMDLGVVASRPTPAALMEMPHRILILVLSIKHPPSRIPSGVAYSTRFSKRVLSADKAILREHPAPCSSLRFQNRNGRWHNRFLTPGIDRRDRS